jgi:V8-like Glu-specific endopeptidase
MKNLILVIIFICYSIGCCAGTIDPNTRDNKYIEYGDKFIYIGQIVGTTESDEPYFASCVALNDNTIITAAHVLSQTKNQIILINNKKLSIKKILIHHSYDHKRYGYNDIALASLNSSINLDWYPKIYENKDEIEKICSLSGFGSTGTFKTGYNKSDGYKRAGSNIINSIDRGMLICTPSFKINKTELEFMIAPGDSGGGLFIGNKLAGIHSCIMAEGHKAKSDYKTESGHTRISDHVDWINDTILILKK